MRKLGVIIMTTVLMGMTLTGCGIIREDAFKDENAYIPPYATNDTAELYEDTFYVWEDEKGGTMIEDIGADQAKFVDYKKKLFTPLFNVKQQNSDLDIGDPLRIVWMKDELCENIPTFYKGSVLTYYSTTSFPTTVEVERLYDHGYSVGLYGLTQYGEDHYVMKTDATCGATSDAANIAELMIDDETIISIPYLGETALTSQYISSSGTIKGLNKDSKYTLTVYVGSKRYEAPVTANVRIFSSMEGFTIPDYTFVGNGLVTYEFPEYMKTGYYYISGFGIFRYIAEESNSKIFDEEKYKDVDFNQPIILKSATGSTFYDPTTYDKKKLTFNNYDALNDSELAASEYYVVSVGIDNTNYGVMSLKKVVADFTFKNSVSAEPLIPEIKYFIISDESFAPEDLDNPPEGTFFNPYVYTLSASEIEAGEVHVEWNVNGNDLEAGQYAFIITNVGSYREHTESVMSLTLNEYKAYKNGEDITTVDSQENETVTINKTEYDDYQKWYEEYQKIIADGIDSTEQASEQDADASNISKTIDTEESSDKSKEN